MLYQSIDQSIYIWIHRSIGPSIINRYLVLYYSPSQGVCKYHFRLTNRGQRLHRMHWASPLFPPRAYKRTARDENALPPITTGKTGSGSRLSSPKEKPVFSLSPPRLELFPGQSADVFLTGSSDTPKVRQRSVSLNRTITL